VGRWKEGVGWGGEAREGRRVMQEGGE
jgi:hypothetical protein